MPKSFYRIADTSLCLETPFAEINDFCDYMWQEFVCAAPADNDAALINVLPCSDRPDCYSIYKLGKIASEWGEELDKVPYETLPKALENIVPGHAINQIDKKELITFHAGAAVRNGSGILLLGESGYGKSTLTLELVANHGWNYLSDEVGLLDPDLLLHPFLKTVSCKQDGIVSVDPTWPVRRFGTDHQVTVPRAKHSVPAQLKAVFSVRYFPDKQPSIEPVSKASALLRLMSAQIGREKYVAPLEQMAEVVKRVKSYQLFHNDAAEAARLLTEHMETV